MYIIDIFGLNLNLFIINFGFHPKFNRLKMASKAFIILVFFVVVSVISAVDVTFTAFYLSSNQLWLRGSMLGLNWSKGVKMSGEEGLYQDCAVPLQSP